MIYFGPMGCQTGFYLLFDSRQLSDAEAVELVKETFAAGAVFEGPMPGKSAAECGNYINLDVERLSGFSQSLPWADASRIAGTTPWPFGLLRWVRLREARFFGETSL